MCRHVTNSLYSLLLLFCLYCPPLFAQGGTPGTPNWSAYDGGTIDSLNVSSLSVSLNIPVYSKSGAFPFSFSVVGNDSYIWNSGGTLAWGQEYAPLTSDVNGLLGEGPSGAAAGNASSVTCPLGDGSGSATAYSNWYISLPDRTYRYLPASDISYSGASCTGGFTDQTVDGSGFTLKVSGDTVVSLTASNGMSVGGYTISDAQSSPNRISENTLGTTWTDTLGSTALTTNVPFTHASWSDVAGGSPTFSVGFTGYTLKSSFGCPGKTDYSTSGAIDLPTSFSFPDSSNVSLSYEPNEVTSTDRTGRIQQITFREGGTVTYNWNAAGATSPPYGLNCTYLIPNKVTRTTSDGTVTYSTAFSAISGGSGPYKEIVKKIDIAGNETLYTFTGFVSNGTAAPPATVALTEVQNFINIGTVSSPSYSSTPTNQIIYCYNSPATSSAGCSTATVNLPVLEVSAFTTSNGMSTASWTQMKYDNYGNVTYSAKYDFGATSPTIVTTNTYSPTGSCGPSGTVNNKLCTSASTISNGTSSYTVADSKFTYSTSGNLLTSYVSPNGGTSFLSNPAANVYNANGTPSVTYDVAGNPTSYGYSSSSYTNCSSCSNFPFPTSITTGGLTTYSTYNGAGGVKVTQTDAGGNTTTYGYTDPWNRVTSTEDPLGNTVYKTYSVNSLGSSLAFGSSVNNTTTTLDGYGRPTNTQTQQGPSSSNYDTVSIAYGSQAGAVYLTTNVPCSEPLNHLCGGTNQVFRDVLRRVFWSSTPSTGEYVWTQYLQNDVLTGLYPAPTGENVKQTQTQYDGLGRSTSVCKIESSGGSSCGQSNGTYNGVLTTMMYIPGTGSQTVSSARGAQTRSKTVDGLGRMISTTTPEGGTTTYTYDSVAANYCAVGAYSSPGNLVAQADANGNHVCYYYDALHRLTDVGNNNQSTTNACKRFRYDSPANGYVSQPPGATFTNTAGRLVEAETDAGGMITDEWFSYDKDGNIADMWEWTPHSGQYYHSTAIFAGNGMVTSLQLVSPSLYTIAYGLDGEGRWNTLAEGTTTMVTGPLPPTPMYNAASEPIEVDLTGSDKDVYTYNGYSGNMTQYEFEVGGANETGVLTWNGNSTLQSLAITDGFNSGGSQNCASSYDDLARLAVFDCGSGNWGQDFGYDQYDNLTQTVISGRSGSTWNPGYSTSPSNNHVSGATYDASGNMTNDGGMNVYGYDVYDKLLWTAGSGTPTCGTNGKCITYDAFGRMVEKSSGAAWTEIWYTQVPGSQINMSAAAANYGYWPSPGRGMFVASGTNMFLHQDWLGNDRIVSATALHTVSADRAYAPYGEQYNTFGSTNPIYGMFAGLTGDFDSGVLLDTPNRELAQYQGRWLNPDPAGAGWNQYAYVTNPNSQVDPSGLECIVDCDDPGSWGGWGLFFPGAPGFIPSSYAYGPNAYYGVPGDGFGFSFNASGFDGGCDSDFMPCGLPMPSLSQLLGLPSLSCPGWMGPQCGGINPAMDAAPSATATCLATGLRSMFPGGTATIGSPTANVGGHWNFPVTLQFPSYDAANAFYSTYMASAAGGWPPPARFGSGPALHVENLGLWSVNNGTYSIDATAHIDLFNPNPSSMGGGGLLGLIGHVGIDGLGGHALQFFGANIDPGSCPY